MLPSREVWSTRPEEDPDSTVPSCGARNPPCERVVYPMPPACLCEDERATIKATPLGTFWKESTGRAAGELATAGGRLCV